MKTNRLFSGKTLFMKIVLLAALIVGGGNFAWAQKSLPYSYGFENNNLGNEGWTTINLQSEGTYKSGIAYSSYTSHTGSYYFRFFSNETPPQYLISPLLDDSELMVVVSFYYKNSLAKNTESFCVGYTTVSDSPSTSDFTWDTQVDCKSTSYALYEHTFPAHTKYIAIKSTTTTTSENMGNNYYLCIDDITIVEDNPYKVPTDFTLNSFTENTATFSWTAGNSETAWQFAYSKSSDFTPGTDGTTLNITDNPYTLTGLATGTTYYAAIRADYGDGNYSEWTDKISFVPRAETDTDINETTNTNGYVPFYCSSAGNLLRSQFIIPSSSLSAVSGRQILKLTFYSSASSKAFGKAEFEVYLNEVSNTTYSTSLTTDWGVKVFNSAALSVSDYEMEIEFDTPYNYNGGNLQVGIKQTVAGTGVYMSWYALSSGGNTCRYHNDGANSGSYVTYLPKMTITSTTVKNAPVQLGANGYTTFASTYPLDLTTLPSGLKAYKAAVDAENSKVRFTEINQAVPANTGMLLEGTAGTTYAIPVAVSGSAVEGNDFLVNSTGGTFTDGDAATYTYFAMKKATTAEDDLVFATFNPSTVAIPTDKAYLKVLTSSLPVEARRLICLFDEEDVTTGIHTVWDGASKRDGYYNLQGQRVDSPTKGLYVKDGKKVMVK